MCAISQLPAHWHNALQGNPASRHLHFLEQKGSALQPHLSSLQTLAASGKSVHKGVHESATLIHPYLSGDGRDCIAFRLLDQMPDWQTARFECCSSAARGGGVFSIERLLKLFFGTL